MTLDTFTLKHLDQWINSTVHWSHQELTRAYILHFLGMQDATEGEYWINRGWSDVRDEACKGKGI